MNCFSIFGVLNIFVYKLLIIFIGFVLYGILYYVFLKYFFFIVCVCLKLLLWIWVYYIIISIYCVYLYVYDVVILNRLVKELGIGELFYFRYIFF